ncbi:M17 family peptidase N-terminal domain-containing protein [Sphingomonas azotifigens]|uniref:M17 family peptidase N-terminal domain-containing protein n=1 Tax=Sphingomonas azotifigens TaxID=330920 RepID=UPI000A0315C8|nr:M17 family peptidase N-terminal domain-containing protein [Sphingomonas azotifigens]
MTRRQIVGTLHGVAIEVAAWDGSAADVDLSCACMFASELGGGPPVGGLAHLDRALDGQLLHLRTEGVFAGQAGETLYLDRLPPAVTARALLILGMGSPDGWRAAQLAPAVRAAVSTALALRVGTGALAPSMLDSGLGPDQTGGAPAAMVEGLAAALAVHARVQAVALVRPRTLTRWTFDVGAARFEGAVAAFGAAVAEHQPAGA